MYAAPEILAPDRSGAGTAGCGTFPQGSLPAVAAGAERQSAPGGGACPQRRRPGVAPVRRVAELRDLPTGFGGLLRRPPLPAGRLCRVGGYPPHRPACRHRRLAGPRAAGACRRTFPQDRHCRHVPFGVCRMAFALLLDRCPACGRSRGRGFAVGMARYGDARQAHVRARAVGVDAGADRRRRSARQRPLRAGRAFARALYGQKSRLPGAGASLLRPRRHRAGVGRRRPAALLPGRIVRRRPACRHPFLCLAVRSCAAAVRPQGLRPCGSLYGQRVR